MITTSPTKRVQTVAHVDKLLGRSSKSSILEVILLLLLFYLATLHSKWNLKLPDQGLNPHPLHWKHGTTGPPGKPRRNIEWGYRSRWPSSPNKVKLQGICWDIPLPHFELLIIVYIVQQLFYTVQQLLCFVEFTLFSINCHSLQLVVAIQPINFYLFNCYIHCLTWMLIIYFLTCVMRQVFFNVRLSFFSCQRYYAIKNDLVWIVIFISLTMHNIFLSTIFFLEKNKPSRLSHWKVINIVF